MRVWGRGRWTDDCLGHRAVGIFAFDHINFPTVPAKYILNQLTRILVQVV
jgi:hypothetical protein